MTLLDKQIKAVQETKEWCIKEALLDANHSWHWETCPLCKNFYQLFSCRGCPLNKWHTERGVGCGVLLRIIYDEINLPSPQDLACFLYSLELYLRERRHKKVKIEI